MPASGTGATSSAALAWDDAALLRPYFKLSQCLFSLLNSFKVAQVLARRALSSSHLLNSEDLPSPPSPILPPPPPPPSNL